MIPKAVDVAGKPYTVLIAERESGDYGECFSDHCRIEIASYQCDHQMRDTLLHEVMHAVDHEMNTNLREAQIRRMATGLLQVLRHNPEFVRFLVANADP